MKKVNRARLLIQIQLLFNINVSIDILFFYFCLVCKFYFNKKFVIFLFISEKSMN